jgi:hypothetical protein
MRDVTRKTIHRAEPELSTAVAVGRLDLISRQAFGGGEVLHETRRGVEPVDAPRGSHIDPTVRTFGDTTRLVYREPLRVAETGEPGRIRVDRVDADDAATRRGDPKVTQMISRNVLDEPGVAGNPIVPPGHPPAAESPHAAAIKPDPNVTGGILGERRRDVPGCETIHGHRKKGVGLPVEPNQPRLGDGGEDSRPHVAARIDKYAEGLDALKAALKVVHAIGSAACKRRGRR